MSLPNLPAFFDMSFTQDNGRLTADGYMYLDQTFQTLNALVNMFNNGVQYPQKTTAEIVALEPSSPTGTTWFNTTLAKLQVKTAAGVIETITSV
jgi:hypothetical protein